MISRHRIPRYDMTKDGRQVGDKSFDQFLKQQTDRVRWRLRDREEIRERRPRTAKQHYNGSWVLTSRTSETKQLQLERAPRKSQEMVSDES